MNRDEIQKSMIYRARVSAVKEKTFLRRELEEKIRAEKFSIFILSVIQYLLGLWISPLAATHQTGINPILLYNFLG